MNDLLEPVSLLKRIRLGQNALVQGLDPTQEFMPYWNVRCEAGQVAGFRHAGAGTGATTWRGRYTRCPWRSQLPVTPSTTRSGPHWPPTSWGFSATTTCRGVPTTHPASASCTFTTSARPRTLAALVRKGHDSAGDVARRMVRTVLAAVDDEGVIDLAALPDCVASPYTRQSHQEGRAVDSLVRLFRANGDEAAIELAARMTRFALDRCFTEAGRLRPEAGTHGHSINAMVAGMADLALLTGDADMLLRVKAIYDVGLPSFNSSFGWSMEALNRHHTRGESNNTEDLLRAALLLGSCGWARYYEDAERILRSHLLPSQVNDVGDLPDDEVAGDDARSCLASRLRGGFSFPTPNDLLIDENAPLTTYDITSGAVDGLCEAHRATVTCKGGVPRVHLLFSGQASGVSVESALPREGKLRVNGQAESHAMVRLPSWADHRAASVRIDGQSHSPNLYGALSRS